MTERLDVLTVLTKLRTAIDIMRDVRPEDATRKEKIDLAIATVESAVADVRRTKPN